MKVQQLYLSNFKRFGMQKFDFRDTETGLAQDLIVLIGQNGSGKSTVLQAIAAMLGTATGRLSTPADLNWPGFNLNLANEAWARPIEIELRVEFSQDEIEATRAYFSRTLLGQKQDKTPPGQSNSVKLQYNPELNRVTAPTAAEYFQFQGRNYAKMISKYAKEGDDLFKRVGDVFWYTEDRTTNSMTPVEGNGKTINFNITSLRWHLSKLFDFHGRIQRKEYTLRPGKRDIFHEIEEAYQAIFPNHRLDGPVPSTGIGEIMEDPWFYLFDGRHPYELSEMSGGERAVFPMLFDFANWSINNSVILIDELELHLHPPHQQGLLKALSKLGRNNQFIITTHSDAIESIVPNEAIRRL